MGAIAEDERAADGAVRSRRVSPGNFYRKSFSAADQIELEEAGKVEGLADEIAALRVRLKTALGERPEDLTLMIRGIDLLMKAVAAQYRLSPKSKRDLADSFAAVLNSLGDQLLPADR